MFNAKPPGLLRLYLRAHRIPSQLIIISALTAFDVAFGQTKLAVPSASHVVAMPLRRELPMLFAVIAVIAVGSVRSALESIEQTAGIRLPRWETRHLATAIIAATGLVWLTEAFGIGPVAALSYARSVLIWAGLALLSGRLFSRATCWILPVATIFPLIYYSQGNDGARWWAWTWQEPGDPRSWGIAVVTMAVGVAAFALTPWRQAAIRRAFHLPARRLPQVSTQRDSTRGSTTHVVASGHTAMPTRGEVTEPDA